MNTVKSILLLLLPICLLLAPNTSYAGHAAIMIDASNGSVLHEENATHSWYPASLTKVMTLYMTFDALKAGEIQLNDILTASAHAARQPQSKLGLRQGEKLTVQDAILAVITRSANDAAVVLSEHLGGTEENFAIKMTAKGHSLGMYDSHFMNATGLPHPWQVTTSRDMALLAWKTQQNFPNYYPFFSAHTFNFKGRELHGINKFTANYPGAEGMKTGFTCGSGYNLISVANQNGKRLIGVILGGMTSPERYQLMIKMMNKLDVVVLCCGDGDFLPLVEYLKMSGQLVEVCSFGKSTAIKLKESADNFIDLDLNPKKFLFPIKGHGIRKVANTTQLIPPVDPANHRGKPFTLADEDMEMDI